MGSGACVTLEPQSWAWWPSGPRKTEVPGESTEPKRSGNRARRGSPGLGKPSVPHPPPLEHNRRRAGPPGASVHTCGLGRGSTHLLRGRESWRAAELGGAQPRPSSQTGTKEQSRPLQRGGTAAPTAARGAPSQGSPAPRAKAVPREREG